MKKALALLILVILFASSAYAAQWVGPLAVKHNWDRKESGFCPGADMCLVTANPNAKDEYNGNISRYFTNPPGPKCISNGQYILEYYCENGKWTARTKLVGLTLLEFAKTKSNDYVLLCGDYKTVLNNYRYVVGSGANAKLVEDLFKDYRCDQFGSGTRSACVNNICVLKYPGGTAFGASLNAGIADADYSFLHAMNHSVAACNNVQASSNAVGWYKCNGWTKSGGLFYNPALNSVIYLSTQDFPVIGSYAAAFDSFVKPCFDKINLYVAGKVHNPAVPALDFGFFKDTGLFNNWYYSRKQNKVVFSFLEKGQTEFGYDYLGALYSGYVFGSDLCNSIFRQYGEVNKGRGVFCEGQAGSDFVVAAKGARNSESPLTGAWPDLSSKLRPK